MNEKIPGLGLTRRDALKLSAAGVMGASLSGWLDILAARAAEQARPRHKACILLWMDGGPSHKDTFDLKPGTEHGGPYRAINTSAPGVQISEHFPQLARLMHHGAIIRSMSTSEGAHGRAKYYLHTGYREGVGGLVFPSLGAICSVEIGNQESPLPNYVSIGNRSYGSGFLGARHQPLVVTDPNRGVENLQAYVNQNQFNNRVGLLEELEQGFHRTYDNSQGQAHRTTYQRAVTLMRDRGVRAFDLADEPAASRARYGGGRFGDGVLMARRLVEAGVSFVEVSLGGWDTHQQNFERVQQLSAQVDPAMSALVSDLRDRGMLDDTLVLWMGEFGRTPRINTRGSQPGRDHYPRAWSSVMFGGGIRGGQVIGRTDREGAVAEERPVPTIDFMATVCSILGIDFTKFNQTHIGRPIRIVDRGANPIRLTTTLVVFGNVKLVRNELQEAQVSLERACPLMELLPTESGAEFNAIDNCYNLLKEVYSKLSQSEGSHVDLESRILNLRAPYRKLRLEFQLRQYFLSNKESSLSVDFILRKHLSDSGESPQFLSEIANNIYQSIPIDNQMLLDKAEEYLDALNKLLWEENNSNEALYNSFLVESFPDVAEKKNQSNSAADFINNHIKKFGNLTRSGNDTTFFFHVNAESITKPPYFDLIQYQAAMSMMKMRQPVQAPSIATEKVAPQFVPKTNNVHYAKQIGPAVFDTTPAVQFQASRTAVSTVQANNVAMIVLIAFLIFVALIVWFVASRNQPPNRKKYKRPKRTMQETLTDIIDAIIQSQFVIAIGTVFRDPSSAAKEFRLLYKAWVEIFQDDFHPFCRSIVTESLEVLSNILMLPYRSLLSNSNNSKPQKEAAPISSTGTKPSEILTASKTKSTSNRNLNVDNSKNAVRKDKEKEKDKDKEKEKEKEKDKEKEKEKEKDKDKEKEVRDKTNEKEKEKDSKDKEKVKKHIEPAEPTNPLDFIVSQPDDENDSVVKLIELSKQIDETTSLPSKTNSTDNSDANSTISVEQLSGPSKENKNDAGLFVDSDLEPRREDIIDDMSPTRSSDENHTSIEPAFSISKEEELIDNVRRTSSASLFEGSNPAEAEMTDFVSALRNSSNDILDDHFIDKAKSHDLDELQFSLKPSEASLPAFANIESTFSLFGPNMLNHSQQSDNDSLFNLTPPRKKDSLAHLLNEREQSEFDNQANPVSDATGISLNWLQMNNTSSKPSTTQPAKTGIYRPPPLKQQQQAFSNSATLSSTTNSLGSFGKKSYSKPSTKAPYDDYNMPPEVVATNNIVKPLFANINNPTISKAPSVSVSRIVDGKKAVNSKKPLQSEEVGFWRRVNEDELEPTNSRAASLAMPTSTSTIDSLLFSPPPPGFSVSNDVRPIGDSRQGNFNSLNPAVNINASSMNIAPQLSLSQPSTIVVVTIVATCTLLNPTITSSIKIASNIFGQWQILGAKPMRCSLANPSLWNLTIDIPRNFSYFSYKYVAIDIQKNIWVEPGPPRVINLLKVNSPTGEFLQKDKFENGIRVADEAMYLF